MVLNDKEHILSGKWRHHQQQLATVRRPSRSSFLRMCCLITAFRYHSSNCMLAPSRLRSSWDIVTFRWITRVQHSRMWYSSCEFCIWCSINHLYQVRERVIDLLHGGRLQCIAITEGLWIQSNASPALHLTSPLLLQGCGWKYSSCLRLHRGVVCAPLQDLFWCSSANTAKLLWKRARRTKLSKWFWFNSE